MAHWESLFFLSGLNLRFVKQDAYPLEKFNGRVKGGESNGGVVSRCFFTVWEVGGKKKKCKRDGLAENIEQGNAKNTMI